jgi:hypothetical protein
LGAEVLIVLGLSLGQSAVYAVVSLIAKLTQGPLSQATATLTRPDHRGRGSTSATSYWPSGSR